MSELEEIYYSSTDSKGSRYIEWSEVEGKHAEGSGACSGGNAGTSHSPPASEASEHREILQQQ